MRVHSCPQTSDVSPSTKRANRWTNASLDARSSTKMLIPWTEHDFDAVPSTKRAILWMRGVNGEKFEMGANVNF